MQSFALIMLILPLVLFVLPGENNWGRELPRLVVWYLVFGGLYFIAS